MLVAAAIAGYLAGCVPARWFSGDPKSLELLNGSPISCLLVDAPHWTEGLVTEGHRRGLKMLAVVDSGRMSVPAGADAVVIEGTSAAAEQDGKPVISLAPRERIRPAHGIAGTSEGVWPGVRIDDDTMAGPTAAPWIDTNLGYLRYLRSQVRETIWLANRPPRAQTHSGRRYQQALADAALAGAHWVIAPDGDFAKRLLAGEAAARKDWTGLMELAGFIESLPHAGELETYSRLGVSVSRETGAFVSSGVLDMIGAQHIPFQVVRTGEGLDHFFDFADTSIVKFPKTSLGRVAMRREDVDDLEVIYRRVQVIVGRTNFGIRVFNGAAVLSAPYVLANGGGVLVLLANYTDYPVERITLHVRGSWKKATLECPGAEPRSLAIYPVQNATAVEIDSLPVFGAVRVE